MATWLPLPNHRRGVYAVEVIGEGAPGVEDGLSLNGVAGFTLYALCNAGETFNDASGTLKAYRYDEDASTVDVMTRASELDVTVGADGVGERGICATFTVASPRGRIVHIWDGTSVTGGNVTVTYVASLLVGLKA